MRGVGVRRTQPVYKLLDWPLGHLDISALLDLKSVILLRSLGFLSLFHRPIWFTTSLTCLMAPAIHIIDRLHKSS